MTHGIEQCNSSVSAGRCLNIMHIRSTRFIFLVSTLIANNPSILSLAFTFKKNSSLTRLGCMHLIFTEDIAPVPRFGFMLFRLLDGAMVIFDCGVAG